MPKVIVSTAVSFGGGPDRRGGRGTVVPSNSSISTYTSISKVSGSAMGRDSWCAAKGTNPHHTPPETLSPTHTKRVRLDRLPADLLGSHSPQPSTFEFPLSRRTRRI